MYFFSDQAVAVGVSENENNTLVVSNLVSGSTDNHIVSNPTDQEPATVVAGDPCDHTSQNIDAEVMHADADATNADAPNVDRSPSKRELLREQHKLQQQLRVMKRELRISRLVALKASDMARASLRYHISNTGHLYAVKDIAEGSVIFVQYGLDCNDLDQLNEIRLSSSRNQRLLVNCRYYPITMEGQVVHYLRTPLVESMFAHLFQKCFYHFVTVG